MFVSYIKGLLVTYKFRRTRLKFEGKNVKYKYLSSTYVSTELLIIEDNVFIGPNAHIDATGGVTIKTGCILAPFVTIYSRTHNYDSADLRGLPFDNRLLCYPVTVGEYTWIGRGAIIMPGVTIGKGCVIGANTVITKDIPDYAVVVGNPGTVVKFRRKDIFDSLLRENKPFVYERFGHKKIKIYGE